MRSSMYLLGMFLFCFSYWLHRSVGKPDIEQITYHMNFGVELMNTVDPAVTHRFIRWCVLARRSQRCRAIFSRLNKGGRWWPTSQRT